MTNSIDLEEAKRQLKLLLRKAGYEWMGAFHIKSAKVLALNLRYEKEAIPMRALLWPFEVDEGEWWWEAMISLQIGKEGEFPLDGGRLGEWEPKPAEELIDKRAEVSFALEWWKEEPAEGAYDPLSELALFNLKRGNPARAISILESARRGEFRACSISETLEMAQMKWGNRREELLQIALIWWKVYEP